MKKVIALGLPLGMALGFAAIQPAYAQYAGSNPTGPYIGAALGLHYFDDDDAVDVDEGGSIDAQLGYRVNDNLRLELEAGAIGAEIDGSDDNLAIARATIGLYYDFLESDRGIVPYIGAGVGIAGVVIDEDDVDDDDEDLEEELTFHADAGVSLNLNPYFAIVPSYRYTWTDDSNGVTDGNITSHAVRVGLRLSF